MLYEKISLFRGTRVYLKKQRIVYELCHGLLKISKFKHLVCEFQGELLRSQVIINSLWTFACYIPETSWFVFDSTCVSIVDGDILTLPEPNL